MRLWLLASALGRRNARRENRQAILPLDEREAELLRRHRATREIEPERNS